MPTGQMRVKVWGNVEDMRADAKKFKILALDGGGVRGIIGARILDLIHTKLDVDIYNDFDLIVGTSTGSIIAATIATKGDISKLVKKYKDQAPKIFKKNKLRCSLLFSKYNSKTLENFLREEFSSITLGEIKKPLIINATNIITNEVRLFKSQYQKLIRPTDYVIDENIPLCKAILASCAAPTYFNPVAIGNCLLCDGGLWANNPALVGYIDSLRNFDFAPENIKILSLGTGLSGTSYTPSNQRLNFWRLFTGWRKRLVDVAMNCNTQFPQNCLQLIIPSNILRINPIIGNWDLDDYSAIPALINIADSEFAKNSGKISEFWK